VEGERGREGVPSKGGGMKRPEKGTRLLKIGTSGRKNRETDNDTVGNYDKQT